MDIEEDELARPSQDQINKQLAKTREKLEERIQGKLNAAAPRHNRKTKEDPNKPLYIRYTPANQNTEHNSGARSRVIKLHKMQVDPLEPPKHRHTKGPQQPPSPPVPIMHSPPRNITQEDQKNWKIPPCVSNWKNNRGYAVPLHQRLATSGRNLQNNPVNERFASLAEALYHAERAARQQVEERARERRTNIEKLRAQREADLSVIAKQTRDNLNQSVEREVETPLQYRSSDTPLSKDMSTPSNMGTPGMGRDIGTPGRDIGTPGRDIGTPGRDIGTPGRDIGTPGRDIGTPGMGTPGVRDPGTPGGYGQGGHTPGLTKEAIEERNEREKLRQEARRLRKRQMGLEKAKGARARRDRDISEQIALGQNVNTNSGEGMFDQRLFNQDGGMNHGFGAEDGYNIYDGPMRTAVNTHLYRPTAEGDQPDGDAELQNILEGGTKFTAHRGFEGTEAPSQRGSNPVQFEKQKPTTVEEDPFNIGELESEKPEKEEKPERSSRPERSDKRD
eukprot:UN30914